MNEFQQDKDSSIRVTAMDNAERVQRIIYDAKHGLTRKVIASEVHELRSDTQSIAWIARQTRPDLSCRISKIQNTFENATEKDLRERKRIVEHAMSTSTRGIYYSSASSWDDVIIVKISDVRFNQER